MWVVFTVCANVVIIVDIIAVGHAIAVSSTWTVLLYVPDSRPAIVSAWQMANVTGKTARGFIVCAVRTVQKAKLRVDVNLYSMPDVRFIRQVLFGMVDETNQ